jgi:hypothetical protein
MEIVFKADKFWMQGIIGGNEMKAKVDVVENWENDQYPHKQDTGEDKLHTKAVFSMQIGYVVTHRLF